MTLLNPTFVILFFEVLINYSTSFLSTQIFVSGDGSIFSIPDTQYQGCYRDKVEMLQRSMPNVQEIRSNMTINMCVEICSNNGFEWSGLQYEKECYCSREPPKYEKIEEKECSTACGGNREQKCGGALALSVYRNKYVKQPPDTGRPLVCLVMILKNEAHTILNTLKSVKNYIDCWYILDTGSTDNTKEIISDYLKDLPGKLFEESFVDYGYTRNRILILAAEQPHPPLFTLMLSADEKVENPDVMRRFLQEQKYSFGQMHGAYPVVMNTGIKFDSLRIARVDAKWRYKARVHEYLAPPEGPYMGVYRSTPDITVQFNATDGDRRYNSQYFIKRILEEDLAKDGNDTRSIYYLARTHGGLGNHTGSFYYYDLLAQRSKWNEEVYHGKVMKAVEAKFVDGLTWQDRQSMLLDAFHYKPDSMDALHTLAQDHYDSGRFHLAYLFMHRAVHIPPPSGLSGAENVLLRPTKYLYDYEGYRLLGFAAREIKEWEMCIIAFRQVLKKMPNDEIVKDRMRLCETKLAEEGKAVPLELKAPQSLQEKIIQQQVNSNNNNNQLKPKHPELPIEILEPIQNPEPQSKGQSKIPKLMDLVSEKAISTDDEPSTPTLSQSLSYSMSPTFILTIVIVFGISFAIALTIIQRMFPPKKRRHDD